ncbi:hypothetical protein GCWU000246_01222 [Jonquetella anthropi E3_33 E1]|nr:hypothetical protein GCWU000246_01222 [Jonquetella anthropi E3_33 E1]
MAQKMRRSLQKQFFAVSVSGGPTAEGKLVKILFVERICGGSFFFRQLKSQKKHLINKKLRRKIFSYFIQLTSNKDEQKI